MGQSTTRIASLPLRYAQGFGSHRNDVAKWSRNDEEGDVLAMTKDYVVRPFRVVHEAEASHYIFKQSCMRFDGPFTLFRALAQGKDTSQRHAGNRETQALPSTKSTCGVGTKELLKQMVLYSI